jgi:hypothetical protein
MTPCTPDNRIDLHDYAPKVEWAKVKFAEFKDVWLKFKVKRTLTFS